MISVIICSINKTFAQNVRQSIADTIGVAWEAIIIDNTLSPESITKVYNSGASRAKYDILCFAHEDILFKTQNWGSMLVDNFNEDRSLGIIGVAGSKYKSKTPSGWFTGIKELDCCNITHLNKSGQFETIYFNPSDGTRSQQVIVLDGVFLCCPKKVWLQTKFNEVLLKDFHLYDLDFSLRVAKEYKTIVTFDIDILHITKGAHYGNKWLDATLVWHKAMQQNLPFAVTGYNFRDRHFENRIIRTWLIRLKHEDLNLYNKLLWLHRVKIWAHLSAWPNVLLFLIRSIFYNKDRIVH